MDKDQLQAFLIVAATKNFTKAAERLHVTQSTVTTRIQTLEQHLGHRLFDRNNRRVSLTIGGHTFLPMARRIVELMDESASTLRTKIRFDQRFVIGAVHSIWDFLLDIDLDRFHKIAPRVALKMITDHSDQIIEKIIDGTVDLGFVFKTPHHPDLTVLPVIEESFSLVAHPSIDILEPIEPKDLASLPLYYLRWGDAFAKWFEIETGHESIPIVEVDHGTLLIRYLQSQLSVGFILNKMADRLAAQRKIKRLSYANHKTMPVQTVYAVYKKQHLNPVIETILKAL